MFWRKWRKRNTKYCNTPVVHKKENRNNHRIHCTTLGAQCEVKYNLTYDGRIHLFPLLLYSLYLLIRPIDQSIQRIQALTKIIIHYAFSALCHLLPHSHDLLLWALRKPVASTFYILQPRAPHIAHINTHTHFIIWSWPTFFSFSLSFFVSFSFSISDSRQLNNLHRCSFPILLIFYASFFFSFLFSFFFFWIAPSFCWCN